MKTDEKLCPFCAETIKAAAVKCRFCQSDLPPDADGPPAAPPEPAGDPSSEVPEPPTTPLAGTVPMTPGTDRDRPPVALRAALAIASLGLAAGSGWFFTHDRVSERADGLTLGGDQQVVTTSYREEARREAGEKAETILSYSYRTLEQDRARATALMAPDFAEEYATAMAANQASTLDGKITQKATVVATSLVSLEPRSAKVLLFVDLSTTAGDSPTPRSGKERALVSMTRKDGDWIVTDVDAF